MATASTTATTATTVTAVSTSASSSISDEKKSDKKENEKERIIALVVFFISCALITLNVLALYGHIPLQVIGIINLPCNVIAFCISCLTSGAPVDLVAESFSAIYGMGTPTAATLPALILMPITAIAAGIALIALGRSAVSQKDIDLKDRLLGNSI